MAKVAYRKKKEIKILGFKIAESYEDYVEFSNDNNTDEDLFNIKIDTEKIRRTK